MLNIGYFKSQPNEFIIKYASGRVAREGQGLAFVFWKHNTQVVAVPTSSVDANLVFNEVTRNFQSVTIQGQFTYRIHDPKRASELLNFAMDPATREYVSNDPDRLAQRITNVIQMETRTEIQKRSLEEVLSQFELDVYRTVDSRKLMALAINDLGQNAGRIGNLTITSEILAALLNGRGNEPTASPD